VGLCSSHSVPICLFSSFSAGAGSSASQKRGETAATSVPLFFPLFPSPFPPPPPFLRSYGCPMGSPGERQAPAGGSGQMAGILFLFSPSEAAALKTRRYRPTVPSSRSVSVSPPSFPPFPFPLRGAFVPHMSAPAAGDADETDHHEVSDRPSLSSMLFPFLPPPPTLMWSAVGGDREAAG